MFGIGLLTGGCHKLELINQDNGLVLCQQQYIQLRNWAFAILVGTNVCYIVTVAYTIVRAYTHTYARTHIHAHARTHTHTHTHRVT